MSTLSLWRHPWTGEERIYVDGVSEQGMWFEPCATSTDRDWAFCSELPCARDGRTRHRSHANLDLELGGRKLEQIGYEDLRRLAIADKGFCEPS